MPNIYHSDEVFDAYLAEHDSVSDAKQAIKDAARANINGNGGDDA